MIPSTEPGVEIFSAEWMRRAAVNVPPEWHPVILDLCQSYALGNSTDPATVYRILCEHGVGIAPKDGAE